MSDTRLDRRWIDLTRPLHNGMISWPRDPEFQWRRVHEITGPGTANLSVIETCVHIGTHIDAPLHFIRDGIDIDSLPLDALCGEAVLIHVTAERDVFPDDFADADIRRGDRVLIRTVNERRWSRPEFDPDFFAISGDAAKWLAERGVRLVGIDYLSVDGYNDKGKLAHYALLGAGVIIIEGLDLSRVAPGRYELVALPLRIVGSDGSPARVILRPPA